MKGNTRQSAGKYESAAAPPKRCHTALLLIERRGFFPGLRYFKKGAQTPVLKPGRNIPFIFLELPVKVQADSVALVLRQRFLYPGGTGIHTRGNRGAMGCLNGWASLLHWMAISGLLTYDNDSLASEIAGRWAHSEYPRV